jgi:hypothetical protein
VKAMQQFVLGWSDFRFYFSSMLCWVKNVIGQKLAAVKYLCRFILSNTVSIFNPTQQDDGFV